MRALLETSAPCAIIRQFFLQLFFFVLFFSGIEVLRERRTDTDTDWKRAGEEEKKNAHTDTVDNRRAYKFNKHVLVLVCVAFQHSRPVSVSSQPFRHSTFCFNWKPKKEKRKKHTHTHVGSLTHTQVHTRRIPNNTKNNNLWWFKVDNFTFFFL